MPYVETEVVLKYIDFRDGKTTLHTGHIQNDRFETVNFALCQNVSVGFAFFMKEDKFMEKSGPRKFPSYRVTYFTNFHEEMADSYEDIVIMTEF
jgi:hypothetical protein